MDRFTAAQQALSGNSVEKGTASRCEGSKRRWVEAGAGIGTCRNLDRSFMTADAIGGKRGMRQDALAQLDAVFPGVHRLAAHYQARKIELKFMAVMRRVRTFDFAELASVAKVDDALLLCRRHRSYVAVVAIDRVEQRRVLRCELNRGLEAFPHHPRPGDEYHLRLDHPA